MFSIDDLKVVWLLVVMSEGGGFRVEVEDVLVLINDNSCQNYVRVASTVANALLTSLSRKDALEQLSLLTSVNVGNGI